MHPRATIAPVLLLLATTVGLVACGGGSGATPAPASAPAASPGGGGGGTGAIDCSLLAPADFAANGVQGASDPSDNPDGTSHYCVYAGTSGATGGIEFDVFPNDSVADAEATYDTALGEGPQGAPPAGGSFSASSFATADGVAYLTVRQGPLVFALSIPDGAAAEASLVALANLVVQRAGPAAQ
jgi:hypothetical protein